MFKLQPNPTFNATVLIGIGDEEPAALQVEFRHMPRSAVQEFTKGLADKTDAQSLGEIIVGWSGADTKYSPKALETLLDNYPSAGHALFEAFRRGLFESRAKN